MFNSYKVENDICMLRKHFIFMARIFHFHKHSVFSPSLTERPLFVGCGQNEVINFAANLYTNCKSVN